MNSPDYAQGYLRIPLAVWREVYCQAPLTRRQLQIVSVVLRESWGWQQRGGQVSIWTRPLTPRQIAAATGLSTDHLAHDLRTLVARGVLHENGQRYQFVPDAELWKTPAAPPLNVRPPAPKPPDPTAETALRPLASKTIKKNYRNVASFRETDLSPTGDNFVVGQPRTRQLRTVGYHAGSGTERAGMADRMAALIEAFVGRLPAEEREALRVWIATTGVVPVWDRLEPFFRQGRGAARAQLRQILTGHTSSERGGASSPASEDERA